MSETETKRPLMSISAAAAAAQKLSDIPRTERNPTHESDDRDIVGRETPIKAGAEMPLDLAMTECDPDLIMNPAHLSAEQFMNQTLMIHCHDAGGPEDPPYAEVTVNGIYKLIVRGETAEIPRAHAEVLARAKHMRVVQKRVHNSDGSMGFEEKAVLKHTYPFSVLHDPAGRRGADWVRQLFRNPG